MLLQAGRKDAGCEHCSSFIQHLPCSRVLPLLSLGRWKDQSLRVNASSQQSGERGEYYLSEIMGLIRPDEPTIFQPEDQCYFSEVRRWTILRGRFSALIVFHCGNPTGINTVLPSMTPHSLQSKMRLSSCLSKQDDKISYWHIDKV